METTTAPVILPPEKSASYKATNGIPAEKYPSQLGPSYSTSSHTSYGSGTSGVSYGHEKSSTCTSVNQECDYKKSQECEYEKSQECEYEKYIDGCGSAEAEFAKLMSEIPWMRFQITACPDAAWLKEERFKAVFHMLTQKTVKATTIRLIERIRIEINQMLDCLATTDEHINMTKVLEEIQTDFAKGACAAVTNAQTLIVGHAPCHGCGHTCGASTPYSDVSPLSPYKGSAPIPYKGGAPPTAPYKGVPPPSGPYEGAPPPSTPYKVAAPPSGPYEGAPPPDAPYKDAAPPSGTYKGAPPPSTSYKGASPPTALYEGANPPAAPYKGGPPPSVPYEGAPPPSVPYSGTPPSSGQYKGTPAPSSVTYEGTPTPTISYKDAPPPSVPYEGAPPPTVSYEGAPPQPAPYKDTPPSTVPYEAALPASGSYKDTTPVSYGGASKAPPPDLAAAQYIWTKEADKKDPPAGARTFRKCLTLNEVVDCVTIDVTCDNYDTLYVNGKVVGSSAVGVGAEWQSARRYTVRFEPTKQVVVSVWAMQGASLGPAALVLAGVAWNSEKKEPVSYNFYSDSSWKTQSKGTSEKVFLDSFDPKYNDGSWEQAYKYGGFDQTGPWKGCVTKPSKESKWSDRLTNVNRCQDAPKAPAAYVL